MTQSNSLHITPHFTWEEATRTSTGLPNLTSPEERSRIVITAGRMEKVREILGNRAIRVNSWFRSAGVNRAVGGVESSEHRRGTAVDFTCEDFGTPYEICKSLAAHAPLLKYNQLIYEQTWVHISFPLPGETAKLENLTMLNGKYSKGINL